MQLVETTQKFVVNTEIEARDAIEGFRAEAKQKGYSVKKASYEHKTKKSKGAIIDECWVVTVIEIFGGLWEDR